MAWHISVPNSMSMALGFTVSTASAVLQICRPAMLTPWMAVRAAAPPPHSTLSYATTGHTLEGGASPSVHGLNTGCAPGDVSRLSWPLSSS